MHSSHEVSRTAQPTLSATRPTYARIDLPALRHNLTVVRKRVGPSTAIMGVVKANAYGHGLERVGAFLISEGCAMLGVATAEEGVVLRNHGIDSPIFVINPPIGLQVRLCVEYGLEAAVCTTEQIDAIGTVARQSKKTISLHLELETGMNRTGLRISEIPKVLSTFAANPRTLLRGVFTHFAESERPRSTYTRRQMTLFSEGVETLRRAGAVPEMIHMANSGAILNFPESHRSIVRPGIMLYGIDPRPESDRMDEETLHPVMTLLSRVLHTFRIGAGDTVSYGRKYRARRPTWMATIPAGYADGYPRRLSNAAHVSIAGRKFRVAGTICMDQFMVSTGAEHIAPGQEVVLFGNPGNGEVSIETISKIVGTIPYEILCGISARVPRVYTM